MNIKNDPNSKKGTPVKLSDNFRQKLQPALDDLRHNLENIFSYHFGEDALLKYYQGKVQIRKYDSDDRPMVKTAAAKDDKNQPLLDAEGKEIMTTKPWILTKNFALHFPHEALADLLHVNLVVLHSDVLQPYFMAVALESWLQDPIYAALAEQLYDEFTVKALQNVAEGNPPPTADQLRQVTKETCVMVEEMFQYIMPLSLQMADRMPRDRDPEPPPAHLIK